MEHGSSTLTILHAYLLARRLVDSEVIAQTIRKRIIDVTHFHQLDLARRIVNAIQIIKQLELCCTSLVRIRDINGYKSHRTCARREVGWVGYILAANSKNSTSCKNLTRIRKQTSLHNPT
jgi:hypothetical protein